MDPVDGPARGSPSGAGHMGDGFGAVSDELRQAAGAIGNVVGGVARMAWQGPSGDYGHPGVQAGWAQFVEDIKKQIKSLHDKAHEHGDNLLATAALYLESDADAGAALGKAGGLLEATGIAGGGAVGGIAGMLGGTAAGVGDGGGGDGGGDGGPAGFINPEIARRLNPGLAGSAEPAGQVGAEGAGREFREGREGPLY
jgi:hypothetical protein